MACKACGNNHSLRLTCVQYFDTLGPIKIDPSTVATELVANVELVANADKDTVANKRGKDRHKNKDARRIYQRELMRERRAAIKSRGL
jgi:adenylate kinase